MTKFLQHTTITFVLSILPFLTVTYGQTGKDTTVWQTLIQSSDFSEINTVKKINKKLLSKFPAWKRMSTSKGSFNATDFGGGPRRRLYFIAKTDNHWIVSYEHGGRGYHTHCFFITLINENNLLIQDSYQKFKSFKDLKAFAKNEKIPFEKPEGYDY